MDDQEVSLLPVHTYKAPTAAEGGDTDGGDCRVCLTDFNDGDRLRTLPCCHIYHIDCIDQWLKVSLTNMDNIFMPPVCILLAA